MPLLYDDIPGSWGVYSRDWPKLVLDKEEYHKAIRYIIDSGEVPYGSYVSVDNELRLETREYVSLVEKFLERVEEKVPLTFTELREANICRLPQFKNSLGIPAHNSADGSDWSPAQWFQAFIGEAGEYANFRKKYERGDISLEEFIENARKELADTQIYLDILAYQLKIDLGEATRDKFNLVSARIGANITL